MLLMMPSAVLFVGVPALKCKVFDALEHRRFRALPSSSPISANLFMPFFGCWMGDDIESDSSDDKYVGLL